MTGPPTRIISWQQLVTEADPNWSRLNRQPVIYEFSSGRAFVAPSPMYSPPPATDGIGTYAIGVFGIGT